MTPHLTRSRGLHLIASLILFCSGLSLQAEPEVEPQTTSLHGRIKMPDEIPAGIKVEGITLDKVVLRLEGKYSHPRMPYPDNWQDITPDERSKWRADFTNSDEYPDYLRKVAEAKAKRAVFKTEIKEDGSFTFEDVPLAWYQLTAIIMHPKQAESPDFERARAHAMHQFFVKKADEAQRIGTLTLKVKNVLMTGDTAPDWEATGYDGKKFRLSDFRGRFVLMDFWATWCGPCLAEIPNLEATHEALGGDTLEVIGLSVDDTPQIASTFLKKKPSHYTQGFLGQGDTYEPIRRAYGIESIPAIWLIGPDGKILARDLRGPSMTETVRKAMDKATPQDPDKAPE
ncbi:TlpA family protein disulfide reductase [Haloferula sp.]|uniref:TlpA family protein disulfide reductase n=1 Tax=Haloferula sp. TaxID=2497595 RepID=UPI00329F874F